MSSARFGSATTSFTAAANAASKARWSLDSYGTKRPVSLSATTSGIPPTALATTAVSQAIASRFTMPKGSYTDGQAKTRAWLSKVISESRSTCSSIQMTEPSPRSARKWATASDVSVAISGVSGEEAHITKVMLSSKCRAARSRCVSPFCRVIRPTNSTYGSSRLMRYFSSAAIESVGR